MKIKPRYRQNIRLFDEPTPEQAMISVLVRRAQECDEKAHNEKFGSIKWGISTGQGYRRAYAETVFSILRYYDFDLPEDIKLDPIAVREITAWYRKEIDDIVTEELNRG